MGGGLSSRSESEIINSDQRVRKVAFTIDKNVGNSNSGERGVNRTEGARGRNMLVLVRVKNHKSNILTG